jgi:hypothetical protein
VVGIPVTVCAGLKLPHAAWPPQVAVQLTALVPFTSLVTVAVNGVVAPVTTVAVVGETLTVMFPPPPPPDEPTVTTALAETLGEATEVAVSVTVPPLGAVAGAV